MMYLKGTVSWEGLCCLCGYLVAMVTTDILKMYQKCLQRKQKCFLNYFYCVFHIGLDISTSETTTTVP